MYTWTGQVSKWMIDGGNLSSLLEWEVAGKQGEEARIKRVVTD